MQQRYCFAAAAGGYNLAMRRILGASTVILWPEISKLAKAAARPAQSQGEMFR